MPSFAIFFFFLWHFLLTLFIAEIETVKHFNSSCSYTSDDEACMLNCTVNVPGKIYFKKSTLESGIKVAPWINVTPGKYDIGPLHVLWQVSFGCWVMWSISSWQENHKSVFFFNFTKLQFLTSFSGERWIWRDWEH